ncbi:MAG: hypothetical protein LBC64_00515 [Fibromonadaceae bacterium]|jgi:uncharacterized protein (TIGR02145 family)|nr:hypothetical protein [Fibromonadaceae bacterium]
MTKKFFSFAAAVSLFLSCADVPDGLRDEAGGKCNGSAYTEYQFCAYGQIYNLCGGLPFNPLIVDCCNNHQYTLSTEFCSQNNIYRKCGGKEYDPSMQSCLSDVIQSKCGSGSYYNSSTQFCTDNKVYDKCGGNTYDPSNQKCESGVVKTKCESGSNYYDSKTEFCTDNKVYSKCGGNAYNPKYRSCCNGSTYDLSSQRCQNGVVETQCGSDWFNHATYTQYCQNGTTLTQYGSLEYAGQTYRTVEIGTQTWMAENLNYNASGGKCYGEGELSAEEYSDHIEYGPPLYSPAEIQANCDKYGRLYDWSTAMAGSASSNENPSGVKGICPDGWHLPSNAEWSELVNDIQIQSNAPISDRDLKSQDWPPDGTDTYGFAALPGGIGSPDGRFDGVGTLYYSVGRWWSASESYFYIEYGAIGIYYKSVDDKGKGYLYSVRCLQD